MLLSELYANKRIELFDMLNLDATDTGLSKGYIYMSTKDTSICTIKYSLKINDKNNIVVSVPDYDIITDNLDDKVTNTIKKQLIKFAMKHHEKILHFWNHGTEFKNKKELISFLNSINPLSELDKTAAKKLELKFKKG